MWFCLLNFRLRFVLLFRFKTITYDGLCCLFDSLSFCMICLFILIDVWFFGLNFKQLLCFFCSTFWWCFLFIRHLFKCRKNHVKFICVKFCFWFYFCFFYFFWNFIYSFVTKINYIQRKCYRVKLEFFMPIFKEVLVLLSNW